MKRHVFEADLMENAGADHSAGDLGTAGHLQDFLEKCGKFAAYTTPRMKELLFLSDGKFRINGSPS